MTEYQLHLQIAKFLRFSLTGNSTWFHPPNGGLRSKTEAARLKAMGVFAGLPDIGIINDGRLLWIEIKSAKGRVSDAQLFCHAELIRARSPVYVCRSLDDVIAALVKAGVPLKATVAA